VWHVSIGSRIALPLEFVRHLAEKHLDGVGDASLGEWEEFNEDVQVLHLKRRLSAKEQEAVGEAIDIRGTDEQETRWLKVRQYLPDGYKDWKD
jgi:hypothetical protein